MINIDFKNLFLANLQFGNSYSNEIVLAKDQAEAINAINDHYAEPKITAISSLEEILEIMSCFKDEKDLVIIQELYVESDGSLTVKVSKEFGLLTDVKDKHNDKLAVFLDEEKALFAALNAFNYIKNSKSFPMIGDSYLA